MDLVSSFTYQRNLALNNMQIIESFEIQTKTDLVNKLNEIKEKGKIISVVPVQHCKYSYVVVYDCYIVHVLASGGTIVK